jgi:hypothetical protein
LGNESVPERKSCICRDQSKPVPFGEPIVHAGEEQAGKVFYDPSLWRRPVSNLRSMQIHKIDPGRDGRIYCVEGCGRDVEVTKVQVAVVDPAVVHRACDGTDSLKQHSLKGHV